MTKTVVLNVRLPKDLIKVLDTLVANGTFQSKSEAVREFSRDYVRGDKDSR